MSNYFKYNPVARNLFKANFSDSLFENESVNLTIRSILDACMGIYQRIFWDMAPSRERTIKGAGEKLKPIMNAQTMKDLSAILISDAEDSELVSSDYASCKVLYLEALSKYCEALETACDINSANQDYIVETAKKMAQRLMDQINLAAKQLAVEKEKLTNESQYFSFINEGLFTGYRGRVEDLKKILTNLIVQSKDKDQKNGYGRDWNTTFIELDEKRKLLDISRGGFGDKDKKSLEDLEKQVEKFRLEFIKVSQNVIDRNLQKVADDEELAGSYGDMETLCNAAKDAKTRADVQYSQIIVNKKEEHKEVEETFIKTIFPIVRGDNDSNERFKDSGLIYAIQKTFIDGIPSASNLLTKKGAPNGKFGPATEAVIRTLQKISGNKNINGQIDSSLLSDIISSDWVSDENRKALQKALEVTKTKLQESVSVISFDNYFSDAINEGKIIIKDSEFEEELNNQYKETSGESFIKKEVVEKPEGEEDEDNSDSKSVTKLTNNLVKISKISATSDSFLRENGSFKQGYDLNFINAWNNSFEKIADNDKDYLFFYYDGGIYQINSTKTSLKNPSNWDKYEKVDESDDPVYFIRSYYDIFDKFGGIFQSEKSKCVDTLISANKRFKKYSVDLANYFGKHSTYDWIASVNKNYGDIPFIPESDLFVIVENIKVLFKKENNDLFPSQKFLISNIIAFLSNLIYYSTKDKKFKSALKYFVDINLSSARLQGLGEDKFYQYKNVPELEKIPSGLILSNSKDGITNYKLEDSKKTIESSEVGSFNEENFTGIKDFYDVAKKGDEGNRIIAVNLARACNVNYPLVNQHLDRINAKSFDDIPQKAPNKCINSEK